MVRARLWPSSPKRPQFAFSFEFFNWAEALLLEAQVSLNDFCKAIDFKCKHPLTKASICNLFYFIKYIKYYCIGGFRDETFMP